MNVKSFAETNGCEEVVQVLKEWKKSKVHEC